MANSEQADRQFEHLVRAHSSELFAFAYRHCGDRQLAEDLLQECFAQAWKSLAGLNDQQAARAWLYQILRRRFQHHLRDSGRRPRLSTPLDDLAGLVETSEVNITQMVADRELLQQALNQLDMRYKEPLLIVMLEGRTCRETADLLGLPLGTVLSRLHRGREILRGLLQRLGGGESADATWAPAKSPQTAPDQEAFKR